MLEFLQNNFTNVFNLNPTNLFSTLKGFRSSLTFQTSVELPSILHPLKVNIKFNF